MKILFLAPEPFYQERGTPIAVGLILKALSEAKHQVDLLTYYEGEPKKFDRVHHFRIRKIPFIKNLRPGFSMKKVVCDFFFLLKVFSLVRKAQYDLIHAVEESVFMAWLIKKWYGIPYVYDMDSSMSGQLTDRHAFLRPFKGLFESFERIAITNAEAVIAVCKSLCVLAKSYGVKKVFELNDIAIEPKNENTNGAETLRKELHLDKLLVLYVGNLEPYQGVEILIRAFELAIRRNPVAHLIIIGGTPRQIADYQMHLRHLGIERHVSFLGPRPMHDLPFLLKQADILVSPRLSGVNTPMKIYSYLKAGKAILATRIESHTQILSDENALLCEPTEESVGVALRYLFHDAVFRRLLGEKAEQFSSGRFSYETFQANVHSIYDSLGLNGKEKEEKPVSEAAHT